MRTKFDAQLAILNRDLIQMGAICEEVIALAAKALMTGDLTLAHKIEPLTGELDQMERDVEALCLKLLLQQQPVASDLRHISAALKMITDMERIGDQAGDIGEIVTAMSHEVSRDFTLINDMARAAIHMVTGSVDAFVHQDTEQAQQVIDSDDIVDEYFRKVKTSLIAMIARNPEDGQDALDLLMIAKYFERIGDHAVNIAEWVVFSVTGVHKGECL